MDLCYIAETKKNFPPIKIKLKKLQDSGYNFLCYKYIPILLSHFL